MLSRLIALVVLVLVSGCAPSAPAPTATGTGGSPAASSLDPAGPAGPILELVVAREVDREGNPVDPSFTVPADQAQIAVIAAIGQLEGSSRVNLAWYRLPDPWAEVEDAEEELFRHEVEVTSGDLAWSVGTNPGTLAPGSYLVRATLGTQTRDVEFEVASASSAASSSPPGEPTGEPASASGPVSGTSGTAEASDAEPTGRSCEEGVAAFRDAIAGPFLDHTADSTDVQALGSPHYGLHNACVNMSMLSTAIQGRASVQGEQPNPCALPDGSDLPGTTVVATWRVYGGVAAEFPMRVVLGDDTLAPRARVLSNPGPGKQVREGDQIHVTARAQERRSGGPWQMGLARIQLLSVRPSQELVDSVEFTDRRGKACEGKAWEGTLEATYTVPPNPPPVIELCVVAEDWAGNGEGRGDWKCAEFRTGEVWEGTEHGEWMQASLGVVSTHDGTIKLTVAPDGSVSGEGSGTQWAPASTGDYTTTISGTRDDNAFRLKISFSPGGSGDFVVPIRGRTAEAEWQDVGPGLVYTVTIKLKCVSCEEAVG